MRPPQDPPDWPAAEGVMADLVRGRDWAATPLGAAEGWPAPLRAAVQMALDSGFATFVWWGPELRQFHNDAALAIVQDKHPAGLGAPAAEAWREVWPEVGDLLAGVLATGRAVVREDLGMVLHRGGQAATAYFTFSYSPLRDAGGAIAGVLGVAIETTAKVNDIAKRKTAEARQGLLLSELQHRVRNILATVRAIVRRTEHSSDSLEDFAAHLEGRIGSLARTQALLTRLPGAKVDLQNLVRDEFRAQAADEGRLSIAGPDVALSAKAAEVLTLAIHELATNATKYGALAQSGAGIEVRWTVDREAGEDWVHLAWREHGVRVLSAAPRRRGFGTELIEDRVAYELAGRGALELAPGGVQGRIEFPLRERTSLLEPPLS